MATRIESPTVPVVATLAPDEFELIGPVIGWPVYDHVGHLHHKRILWRKRFLAVQGRHLLYFKDENDHDPKYIIDMSNVQLRVDSGSFVRVGDRNEWRWTATTFSIAGYGLPNEKEMHFQATDPADCERWCKALRLAINGRCQRCTMAPSKYSGHKYCIECSRQRKKEKQQARHLQAIIRLRQLMGLSEEPSNPSSNNEAATNDEEEVVGQVLARQQSSVHSVLAAWPAATTAGGASPPVQSSSPVPSPRAGQRPVRLEPLDSPPLLHLNSVTSFDVDSLERTTSLTSSRPLGSPLTLPSITLDSPGSASVPSPSSSRSAHTFKRLPKRIPGLLPHQVEQLPRQRWGALLSGSVTDSETKTPYEVDEISDERGMCSMCNRGFRSDCMVTMLACDHLFHTDCLVDWAIQQATCPCCLGEINVDEM